nr:unnamed protein product [Callosobruchus analis]
MHAILTGPRYYLYPSSRPSSWQ